MFTFVWDCDSCWTFKSGTLQRSGPKLINNTSQSGVFWVYRKLKYLP
jgi:hypothetical protein